MHWEVAQMYTGPDPADMCFFCDVTRHIACHECNVLHRTLHASILCQSEICVGLYQFWAANLAVVASADLNTHPGL